MSKHCTQYRFLRQPAKVGRYSDSDVCEPCRKAKATSDDRAYQRGVSGKYPRVKYQADPIRARLVRRKRSCVAQMLDRQGQFWESIEKLRADWQIDAVSTRLPPEQGHILLPEGRPEDYLEPYELVSDDAHLVDWYNLSRKWESDLHSLLLAGNLPEELLEKRPPYVGRPPISKGCLPWYRFASACALYDVPRSEEAVKFADYGGLPGVQTGEIMGEPTLPVLSSRELLEQRIDRLVVDTQEAMIFRRMWELRAELDGLDYDAAKREVVHRLWAELKEAERALREDHRLQTEYDPEPPFYYIKFVPSEDTQQALLATRGALSDLEGVSRRSGRKPQDDDVLLPRLCAVLLSEGYPRELVAQWAGLSSKRVEEITVKGPKAHAPGS
jgi:hypothetical protein